MGSLDLQNTGEIPMLLKIFVQSFSRIAFFVLCCVHSQSSRCFRNVCTPGTSHSAPLLCAFPMQQVFQECGYPQVHPTVPRDSESTAPSLLLSSCPTTSPSRASLLPQNGNKPLFVLVQKHRWVSEPHLESNWEGEQEIPKSSSCPPGKGTRTNQPSLVLACVQQGRVWGSHGEISHHGSFMGPAGTKTWARTHFYWATETQIIDSKQLVSRTGSCPHFTPFSFWYFLCSPAAFVHCPTRIFT